MARKKKGDDGAEGAEKPKKSRNNMIPAVVLAIGVLGGGWFMGPGKGSASADGTVEETTTTTAAPGPVVVLEPITLNVAGGHYLKVGMALQFSFEYGETAAGAEAEDPTTAHAKALDGAINVFGGSRYEDLVTPAGRDRAKQQLVEQLAGTYDGQLEGVYFTEFVLQ